MVITIFCFFRMVAMKVNLALMITVLLKLLIQQTRLYQTKNNICQLVH